jgi:hypothetical protein
MHEGLTVFVAAPTEIQSARASGEQLTRERIGGHQMRFAADTDLGEEQNQCSAQNNHVSDSR